jgi:hypothetical protein
VARATARQISFADVELMRQGVRLEPLLEAISKFLDSQHETIERVRRDLVRGLKKPRKDPRSGKPQRHPDQAPVEAPHRRFPSPDLRTESLGISVSQWSEPEP